VSLHRLLGFRAAVPDPDALAAFFGELGLTGDADAGWAGSDGGGAVAVGEAPYRRLETVTLGCTDEADVATIAERLGAGGAEVVVADGAVTVRDPISEVRFTVRPAPPESTPAPTSLVLPNAPGATVRANRRALAVESGPRPPRRLGHLVIGTPDPAATRNLLVDGLGLKVSDEVDGFIHFLRCSTDHHNVALVHSPVPLLQHYSWECDDLDHVGHTGTALLRTDPTRAAWGIGRHFAGSNYYWYFRDPSGSFLELYSDLDRITDDAEWEREGRTEFGLEHIANAWGPAIPTEFVVPADLAELEAARVAGG